MKYFLSILGITFFLSANTQERPIELGKVHWIRHYETAMKQSKSQQKPVFLLFQEVPGCATCQNYGQDVLSHPLIVEAIETHFIPLVIFNNKDGADKKILDKFNEPSWNNPVARIVDAYGKDIVNRISGNYSKLAVVNSLIEAIEKNSIIAPKYLTLLRQELKGKNNQAEAHLSMFCFWTGEKEIAQIPGVISTEAGYMDGKEVVKVKYDQSVTDLNEVVLDAKKVQCAGSVYVDKPLHGQRKNKKYRRDGESKYYLHHSVYKYLPMTEMQAMKINRELGLKSDVQDEFLSQRQFDLLSRIKVDKTLQNQVRFDQEFTKTWYEIHHKG